MAVVSWLAFHPTAKWRRSACHVRRSATKGFGQLAFSEIVSCKAMQPDFTSVGFFHFGKDYDKPIPALKNVITKFKSDGKCLENALIVLPEGFNIGKPYRQEERPNVNPSILDELALLSEMANCAFVAGLIIEDSPGIYPPYSSAYLIDGHFLKVCLSRKALPDDTEVSSTVKQPSWGGTIRPVVPFKVAHCCTGALRLLL